MAATPDEPIPLPAAGLPVTAFEEHMLVDDRQSHPMVIVARFDFQGIPPIARLETALAEVLEREPLLRARVERRPGRRPRWLPGPTPVLQVATGPAAADMPAALPRLDPARGPVFHAEIVPGSAGWSLIVAVHHAVCDGLGLIGFMERWFLAVEDRPARRRWSAAESVAALAGRGRAAPTWRGFLAMLPRLRPGLAGIRQYASRQVFAVGGAEHAGHPAGSRRPDGRRAANAASWRPAILVTTLEAAAEESVARQARAAGVRVNDLLSAAFIAALGSRLEEVPGGRPPGDHWIRLGVPMSLRTKSDHALPAANRVSMVFLDRRPGERHDFAGLVRSVHDELELIRSHDLGHIFPLSLGAARWLPGGLRRTTDRAAPQATAVLSNLGSCFRRSPLADTAGVVHVADSRLDGWWMVPPVRPGTGLAAATHETAGRRTIAVHVDESALSSAATAEVIAAWLARLRADEPTAARPESVVAS